MSEKVILLVDGYSEGKNIFQEVIKQNGYWVWNWNCYNVLNEVAYKVGHSGNRNSHYYEFVEKLKDLSDEYFDFERVATLSRIDKFMDDERANVLIIHNCNGKLAVELQEFYANCFDIYIGDTNEEKESYCKTLNYTDPEYASNVLSTMNILTKSFSKGE